MLSPFFSERNNDLMEQERKDEDAIKHLLARRRQEQRNRGSSKKALKRNDCSRVQGQMEDECTAKQRAKGQVQSLWSSVLNNSAAKTCFVCTWVYGERQEEASK